MRTGTRPGKKGIGGARRSQGTGLGGQTQGHRSSDSAQLASAAAYTTMCHLGAPGGKPVNTSMGLRGSLFWEWDRWVRE
jgi:hypothetical protein